MPRDAMWVHDDGSTSVVTLDDDGKPIDLPAEPAPEPFGGKGDHDNNGKAGGAAPPLSKKKPAFRRH